jgi:hypothetical protein
MTFTRFSSWRYFVAFLSIFQGLKVVSYAKKELKKNSRQVENTFAHFCRDLK